MMAKRRSFTLPDGRQRTLIGLGAFGLASQATTRGGSRLVLLFNIFWPAVAAWAVQDIATAGGGVDAQRRFQSGGGSGCLTGVEKNPRVDAGLASQLVDSDGNVQSPVSISAVNSSASSVSLVFDLAANKEYYFVTSMVITPPSTKIDTILPIDQALEELAHAAKAPLDVRSRHQSWWKGFWSQMSVDLGPSMRLLEGFYYGMQYQIGSASAASPNVTPPGLWGPWLTTEDPGWRGDYTLNCK
eukprot:m.153790 g.153790  ORF g.153790 m.153790 type:complete len:243 (+) comp24605_c0_seq4:223-951(+)